MPLITHGEFVKTQSGANDLFWHWRRNNNFTITLEVTEPTHLWLSFNSVMKLNPNMPRMSVYAVSVGLRGPKETDVWTTEDADPFYSRPAEIPGCFARENLLPDLYTSTGQYDRHKYGQVAFSTLHEIEEEGFYRVEVWARARSTYNQGSIEYEVSPNYTLPTSQTPPGERGGADGNVQFDFDPYDAYSATQKQNQLCVKLF